MNKVTNLDEFYKSDVNSILDYITSDDIFDYESQIIEKLSDFELKFNKLFFVIKPQYTVAKPDIRNIGSIKYFSGMKKFKTTAKLPIKNKETNG